MAEQIEHDTVFQRAPGIFEHAMARQYNDFARQRHLMSDCYHWIAPGLLNPEDRLVIHGVLDRQRSSLRRALQALHVGVIATRDMSAVWVKITDPSTYLVIGSHKRPTIPTGLLGDPLTEYLSEQFSEVTAEHGGLVTDARLLSRIAEYSEFLTVLGRNTGTYDRLVAPEDPEDTVFDSN